MIKAHQGIHENFAASRQPAATAIPPGNFPLCAFAPLRLCVKTPVIKSQSSLNQGKNPSNRASSRQIKAADEKAKRHHNERQRRGLIPAQGNALGTSQPIVLSPERAAHPANQGKNPCNRASSRQIKANAKIENTRLSRQPTRWMGRTGRRMVKACTQEKSSPCPSLAGAGEGGR